MRKEFQKMQYLFLDLTLVVHAHRVLHEMLPKT